MSRVIAGNLLVVSGVRVFACDRLFRHRGSSRFTFFIYCYLIYVACKAVALLLCVSVLAAGVIWALCRFCRACTVTCLDY